MPPTRPRTGRWSGAARFLTASLTGGATWGQYARPYGEGYGAADIGGYSAADGCGGYGAARTAAAGLREPGAPQGPRRGQDGRCGGYGAPSRPRTALRRLRGSSAARTALTALPGSSAAMEGSRATTRLWRRCGASGLPRGQDGQAGSSAARTRLRRPTRPWRASVATTRPGRPGGLQRGSGGLRGLQRGPGRSSRPWRASVATTRLPHRCPVSMLPGIHAAHPLLPRGRNDHWKRRCSPSTRPTPGLWAGKNPL